METARPLAANLKRARLAKGLTQQAVANLAGISRIALRDIERGKTAQPRIGTVQAIAEALGVRLQDLLAVVPRPLTARFRAAKRLTRREISWREQIIAEVAVWLRDFDELEGILGDRRPYRLEAVAERVQNSRSTTRPAMAAARARQALGLQSDEPIRDVAGIIEAAGVKIRTIEIDSDRFFGLSVGRADGGPAIVVNIHSSIPVERQIFTAAHELGHLLLHPRAYDVTKTHEDDREEKDANAFASRFLMPHEGFTKTWGQTCGMHTIDRVFHVKRIFHVSYKTVVYRLVETGLADDKVWLGFKLEYRARFGRSLDHKTEPFPLQKPDFVEDRLSRLVRQAVESEDISLSRGAEILGIRLVEMRERIASWEIAR